MSSIPSLQKQPTVERKRVAFYIRVSTQEQKDEGYSPEFQMQQIEDYVKRKDYKGWYTKPEWHFEDIGSGASDDREGLKKLRAAVKNKQVDVVVVWKIDRLARNLSDLLELFEEMEDRRVGFASVKEDIDFTGAIGKLIFQIFGALAEFERETIKIRTYEGKLTSAKSGNYVGGSIPYGYVGDKRKGEKGTKLKLVPREAKVVKQIFDWFVYHNKSSYWIEEELNKMSVPKGIGNPRTEGTKWYDDTIESMLDNEVYRGLYITNRWRLISADPERYEERPQEEWITTKVDRIIDDITFYAARQRLNKEAGRSGGGGKQVYLLKGKIVDAATGKSFVGYMSQKNTRNYRRKQFTDAQGVYHPSISIAAKGLDAFVWSHIEKAIENPDDFIELHRQSFKEGKDIALLSNSLEYYEEAATTANSKIQKVKDMCLEGVISNAEALERIPEHELRRDKALEEKRKIEKQLEELSHYQVACENLRRYAEEFPKGVRSLSYTQKQPIVDMLVERVEIHEGETQRRVRLCLRFDPKAISKAMPEVTTKPSLLRAKRIEITLKNEGYGGSGGGRTHGQCLKRALLYH